MSEDKADDSATCCSEVSCEFACSASCFGSIALTIITLGITALLLWKILISYQTMIPCAIDNLYQNLTDWPCWYSNMTGNNCDVGICYDYNPISANCTYLSVTVRWKNCVKNYSYIFTNNQSNIDKYNYYNSGTLQCLYNFGSCDNDPFGTANISQFTFFLVLLAIVIVAYIGILIYLCIRK